MDLEYIRNSNIRILITETKCTEEYYEVGKSFIIDLLKGVGKLSIKYSQYELIDFPYIYGEIQLSSIILPVLSKICDGAVLAELPAKRNCWLKGHEKENSSGRIDYWGMYKEYSIVLEVKHSFDKFYKDNTANSIIEKWEYMTIDQLQSVKDEIKQYEEQTKGVIRLGLHFVISYSNKSPTRLLVKEYENKLPDILCRLERDICRCKPSITSPDFMACWLPPLQMVLGGEETIPGIILMSKIFKPIQHRGSKVKTNL